MGTTSAASSGPLTEERTAFVEALRDFLAREAGTQQQQDLTDGGTESHHQGLVGTKNAGWAQLVDGLAVERLLIGAILLGQARRALDDVLAFVREREQFGRAAGSFQTMKHRSADLATEVERRRHLVHDAIRAVEADPDSLTGRRSSKVKVTETARRVELEGMQMMGVAGTRPSSARSATCATPIASTIYGGTSEVQREIIGGSYGL